MKSVTKRRLGVLTGGGDCPGLNATLRAITKVADLDQIEVIGFLRGFKGLYTNDFIKITPAQVSGILPRGGTFLQSSRFNPFKDEALVKTCFKNFKKHKLNGLIVIGGDGSLGVALDFSKRGMPVIGIPKTIDNDVSGTERTLGFYTAVQTAVDAIDKLHTTAESHEFIMVVELMGRHCGFLAAYAGMAGGADYILVPEVKTTVKELVTSLQARKKRGKNFSIVVVAEDAKLYNQRGQVVASTDSLKDEYGKIKLGGIGKIVADLITKEMQVEARYTNLGHIQRGGSPSAIDRLLATSFGAAAIELAQKGLFGTFLAYENGRVVPKPIAVVRGPRQGLSMAYYEMARKFFR